MPKTQVLAGVSNERVRSDFATVASHQLRTPISIIRWALDMVRTGRSGRLTAKQREHVERAYQQNSFMARIVGDLLRVSRIESGDLTVTPARVNLAALVRRVVDETAILARAYNCRVRVAAPPRLPSVTTDALKLAEVLHILVDNAIRYGRREGRVTVRIRREGARVVVMVRDCGIGIPKRQQKNVFGKFFRADNAIHSQTEGLGVELYIAREYLRAVGGTINFRSEYRRGTTFVVTLPVRFTPLRETAVPPARRLVSDALWQLALPLSEAVVALDESFRVMNVNPAAYHLLGLQGEVVGGNPITALVRSPTLQQALQRHPTSEETAVARLRLPGETRLQTYQLRLIPLRQQDVIGGWLMVISASDDDPRRRSSAEARLRREREFVTLTVHELNAPLGVSKWSLELLRRGVIGALNREQRRLVDQIYRNNERLLTLVRDLLNLSKLEAGKFAVHPLPIMPAGVISDVVQSFQAAARAKRLSLTAPRFGGLPAVIADPARLAQVVTNLLSNAVKYTPPKGRVTVAARHYALSAFRRRVRNQGVAVSHTDAPHGYVVVTVRDTGIGIASAQLGNVFNKFFRARAALRLRVEGTGLGLYISRAIVELHQGDIWCQSVVGQGSRFSFSVPVV